MPINRVSEYIFAKSRLDEIESLWDLMVSEPVRESLTAGNFKVSETTDESGSSVS